LGSAPALTVARVLLSLYRRVEVLSAGYIGAEEPVMYGRPARRYP
jgi:hypothetical protein